MLIYHKTDGKNVTTQVMIGGLSSGVSHGTHIWEKHQKMVDELVDDGEVLVTGGTFVGAVYEGSFHKRENFKHYLERD